MNKFKVKIYCPMSLKKIIRISDRNQIVHNSDSHCPSCGKCNSFKKNFHKYLISKIRGANNDVKISG